MLYKSLLVSAFAIASAAQLTVPQIDSSITGLISGLTPIVSQIENLVNATDLSNPIGAMGSVPQLSGLLTNLIATLTSASTSIPALTPSNFGKRSIDPTGHLTPHQSRKLLKQIKRDLMNTPATTGNGTCTTCIPPTPEQENAIAKHIADVQVLIARVLYSVAKFTSAVPLAGPIVATLLVTVNGLVQTILTIVQGLVNGILTPLNPLINPIVGPIEAGIISPLTTNVVPDLVDQILGGTTSNGLFGNLFSGILGGAGAGAGNQGRFGGLGNLFGGIF